MGFKNNQHEATRVGSMLIQFQSPNCIIILAALKHIGALGFLKEKNYHFIGLLKALQTAQQCTKKLIFYKKNEDKKNRKPIQAKLTNNKEEKFTTISCIFLLSMKFIFPSRENKLFPRVQYLRNKQLQQKIVTCKNF